MATYIAEQAGAAADYVRLDGTAALTGDMDLGSNAITGLATCTADTDALTKGYLDSIAPSDAAVGTLLQLKGDIVVYASSGVTLDAASSWVKRYDGGTALTVAATGSPSATQLGINSPGVGSIEILDGSTTLLVNGAIAGNVVCNVTYNSGASVNVIPKFTYTASKITLTFVNSAGAATSPTGNWSVHVSVFTVVF